MAEKWDIIVVGAGVGGLTAAARLAHSGRRVLVLDRNSHPGGTAYVFFRKGFTFPMGPLGFSSPNLVQGMLTELGMSEKLELSPIRYRLRAFGLDIPLSLRFHDLSVALSKIFPGEADCIALFFKDMADIARALNDADADKSQLLPWAAETSASGYLKGLIKDAGLRKILGSFGTHEPYSNLTLLAAMWNLMCEEGIFYPRGGMRGFCECLAKMVTKSGEIRLKTEVAEILTRDGKVTGVRLKDGNEIESAAIISNADFKTTFLKLMAVSTIPDEWRRAISTAKQTMSNIQVCIGVDAGKLDLSVFCEADRLIYRRDAEYRDPDWSAEEINPADLAGQELEISLLSAQDAALAPHGCVVIVIRTEAEHAHFARYRPSWLKRSPGYLEYKMRLGRALIDEVSGIIHGINDSIIVTDVATPLTFEEMGGRSGGAVAGWSWDYEDSRDYKSRELIRTPIQCLYMAGYQALSSLFLGGIPTAMVSGMRAAKAVINGLDPIDNLKFS